MNPKATIEFILTQVTGSSEVNIGFTDDLSHGDYMSNIALTLSKEKGQNPREFASNLVTSSKETDFRF